MSFHKIRDIGDSVLQADGQVLAITRFSGFCVGTAMTFGEGENWGTGF